MTTDTTEKGLETLIMRHMTGTDGFAVLPQADRLAEPVTTYGGTGYSAGSAKDYERAYALDVRQLFAFLRATQPDAFEKLASADADEAKDMGRLKFLARLSGEIGNRVVRSISGCSSMVCLSPLSNSRTASLIRQCWTRLSSTNATVTHASGCSSSAGAWCTSRWTKARCKCAPGSRARTRGFCHSTRATPMGPRGCGNRARSDQCQRP